MFFFKKKYNTVYFEQYIFVLFIFIAGLFVYSNTLDVPFYFDDKPNILHNYAVRIDSVNIKSLKRVVTKSPIKSRPVAYLTFSFNYLMHRYNPAGYHLVNIAIHIITSILLYFFILITLNLSHPKYNKQYIFVAWIGSMLWLVHPVQTQSVTYIVQRMNSLSSMFYIASLLFFIRGRTVSNNIKSLLFFLLSLISALLALASKEIAITLPFLIFIYDFFFLTKNNSSIKKTITLLIIISIISVASGYIFLGENPIGYIMRGYANRPFTLSERLLTESRVIFFYISLLFFPHPSRLNLQHDYTLSTSLFSPITTFFSLSGLVVLMYLGWYFSRRDRFISFSILWFLGNLILESSVIPLELVFEHRLYLPSMAFCWLLTYLFLIILPWKKVGMILLATTCIVFAVWTWERNMVWASPLVFAYDTVTKSPHLARAHGSYGEILYQSGKLKLAEQEFQKALQIKPNYPAALNGLGLTLAAEKRNLAAEKAYQQALVINPNYIRAYNNLGILYLEMDEYNKAIYHLKRAVHLRPDYIKAWYNLGLAYEATGQRKQAINCFVKALQFGPVARVNFALGKLYQEYGDYTRALKEFNIAHQLWPSEPAFKQAMDKAASQCLSSQDSNKNKIISVTKGNDSKN